MTRSHLCWNYGKYLQEQYFITAPPQQVGAVKNKKIKGDLKDKGGDLKD